MAAATLADMRLVVTAFVTLDGIIEAPGFDEHRSGRDAWALRFQTDEDQVFNKSQVMTARRSSSGVAPGRSGQRSGRRRAPATTSSSNG